MSISNLYRCFYSVSNLIIINKPGSKTKLWNFYSIIQYNISIKHFIHLPIIISHILHHLLVQAIH